MSDFQETDSGCIKQMFFRPCANRLFGDFKVHRIVERNTGKPSRLVEERQQDCDKSRNFSPSIARSFFPDDFEIDRGSPCMITDLGGFFPGGRLPKPYIQHTFSAKN